MDIYAYRCLNVLYKLVCYRQDVLRVIEFALRKNTVFEAKEEIVWEKGEKIMQRVIYWIIININRSF